MKLEVSEYDLFVVSTALCVLALIWALASCEKIVDGRVKERLAEQSK